MKKVPLVLLTLIPCIVGFLVNLTLRFPVIGTVMFRGVPFLVLIFWFFLGSWYARASWKPASALLIGNATGILSVVIYLWQFLGESDATRNVALAAISQMYSASTPIYIYAPLARLFETQPNYVGQATTTAIQIIALILMAVIFAAGYFWKRNTDKRTMA